MLFRKLVISFPLQKKTSIYQTKVFLLSLFCRVSFRQIIWFLSFSFLIWNVRSMSQGKLEVVKQKMVRVSINILGTSELKWTGMGKFNSGDHYIYCCGQESLRRNGVALIVNKSPKCSTWVQSQKWQNDLCSFPRQTIQYHSNPSLCPNH